MEPRRLLEDNPSEIERALLNAGVTYRCSQTSRDKTLAVLGLAGSAAITAAGVGISATSLVAKLGWPKLIFAVAALGAVTVVPASYYAWSRYHQSVPAVAAFANASNKDQPLQANRNDHSKLVPTESPALEVAPTEDGTRVAPFSKSEPKSEPSVALTEELGALDSARSMLARGDASGALARLDGYNRSFPKGRLQLEAEVLRIDALMKSGQQEQGRKRAQAFLAKHPNSVLASRVRGLL